MNRFALLGLAFALGMTTAAQAAVDISNAPTQNMTCSGGVCTPTAKKAVLNVTDLANLLAASDVKVVTGSGAVTIEVTAPFSWVSANRLTLDADLNVSFKAQVTIAGPGGLTIVTDESGTGGDLLFFDSGYVDFWDTSSSLVINAKSYTLVNNIKTLAADITANFRGDYALAKNYDASMHGTFGKSPIRTKFNGIFEGLGHTIANLTINGKSLVEKLGLFYHILPAAVVRDIGLTNANVQAVAAGRNYEIFGTLAAINSGHIVNSYATGIVAGGAGTYVYIGGLVGENIGKTGVISNSHAEVNVTAGYGSYVGGLTGFNSGLVQDSYATTMAVGSNVGGLVGQGYAGSVIVDSHATSELQAIYSGVGGGVVAVNSGAITGCFASALFNVPGQVLGGGLVGDNMGLVSNSVANVTMAAGTIGLTGGLVGHSTGVITGSFATGSVSGTIDTGGLVGLEGGFVSNSYATVAVSGGDDAATGGLVGLLDESQSSGGSIATSYAAGPVTGGKHRRAGGLVGYSTERRVTDSYWAIRATGMRRSDGGMGLTDSQLKSGLPAGFDPSIWGQSPGINNGYPYLLANPPPG